MTYYGTFLSGVLWECRLCLTDSGNNPGVGHFVGVPDTHIPFNTRNLLLFPASMLNSTTVSPNSDLVFNYLPFARMGILGPNMGLWTVADWLWYRYYYDNNNTDFERQSRAFAASLVARMPVLAIAAADDQLPNVSRDGSDENHYVVTTLEVKWREFAITIAAIICGQTLAITVVLQYCRNVHVRDDSYLSSARLLNTLIMKVDGGSLVTGKELAACLDSLGQGIKYGTSATGDTLVLDCEDEVESSFLLGQLWEESPKLRTEWWNCESGARGERARRCCYCRAGLLVFISFLH